MPSPTGRGALPLSLMDEMIPLEDMELNLVTKLIERGDQHVVCLVLNPFFKKLVWVINLPYPAGKVGGLGLVSGRSEPAESFTAENRAAFNETFNPLIRQHYWKTFEQSGNQYTEPPECTAIREASEEAGIKIRILSWCEERATNDPQTGRIKTEHRIKTRYAEGAILNRNPQIQKILHTTNWLKRRLSRVPAAEEIDAELKRISTIEILDRWRSILDALKKRLGRDPLPDDISLELKKKNDEESAPYWRTIFLCVAMNPGDPNTKALSKEGPPQTNGFRWLPIDTPPMLESNEERLLREQRNEPPPEHAYFTHVHTARNAGILQAIEQARRDDLGAEPGDDLATLRLYWKDTHGA